MPRPLRRIVFTFTLPNDKTLEVIAPHFDDRDINTIKTAAESGRIHLVGVDYEVATKVSRSRWLK